MLKKVLVNLVILIGFTASANAATVMQLKNVSYKAVGESKMEITINGVKNVVEKVSATKYTINSQAFEFSKNETYEQMQAKLEKAYNAGKKKSALNNILMPEAHASFGVIMGALMGGMVGMAVGNSMCEDSSDASSSTYQ